MKKFCNRNCNECSLLEVDETHGDRQLTLLLNVLVNIYGDENSLVLLREMALFYWKTMERFPLRESL